MANLRVAINVLAAGVVAIVGHANAAEKLKLKDGPGFFPPAARPLLEEIPENGIGRNFRLVDHNPLVAPGETLPRGGHGNDVAIAGNCAFAAARSADDATLVVDISKPRRTEVVGAIPGPGPAPSGGSRSSADLSAIENQNLLLRQIWNLNEPFDGNLFEIYDVSNVDCSRFDLSDVRLASILRLPNTPHEHFVWQGGTPFKVLLFVAFSGGRQPFPENNEITTPPPPRDVDLRIYDITDKSNPVGPIAQFSMQRAHGIPVREVRTILANAGGRQRNELHQVSTSPDDENEAGFPTRIYAAHRELGFYIIDSSPFAEMLAGGPSCDVVSGRGGEPNPDACLRKLHPDGEVRLDYHPPFNQSHTHSAHKVPGRPYVVLNDEPGPCPWSWLRFVFIGGADAIDLPLDEVVGPPDGTEVGREAIFGDLFPGIFGAFTIPENLVENCPENEAKFNRPNTSFNAHKSLTFENIVFTSWIAGGVRATDISNPGTPFELGFFFNKPVSETAAGDVDPDLGIRSYPVLNDGLLYFLDGVSGLYILRYTGPRKDEIPQKGLFTQDEVQVPGELP